MVKLLLETMVVAAAYVESLDKCHVMTVSVVG